ncbi:MAG: acetyl-CoA carboxylase biotin carboxylase subunit, partial [Dehalococcoidia bacterium]
MFQKVLIANRGEIALRVARACRELGIKTVAVYSTADAESAVVRFADEAVQIGPPAPGRSYLHIPSIVGDALKTGADALPPGSGFLSEDPSFAEICSAHGITFIGPRPDVMEKVGNKATARDLMQKAGLPLLPGTIEPVGTADEAQTIADDIGYPVIVKAAAGGGGRGMAVAWRREELVRTYQSTRATAQAIFKDSAVYIERYLPAPRHTEVQIMCDQYGNGIYLGERDCSVQRRHQKLIEEAPSIHLTEQSRKVLGEAAVRGALSVGYTGAGTMEFLLDENGKFTFMEMNARIQVEHPVSEMITGLDLIHEQIRVAAGEPLSVTQDQIVLRGHSIECRVNAEDPSNNFSPTPGRLDTYV